MTTGTTMFGKPFPKVSANDAMSSLAFLDEVMAYAEYAKAVKK